MLSNKETICPDNLLNVAHKKKGVPAAIVNAGMPLPMLSTMDAVNENLITPILIGDKNEIENCANNLKFDISRLSHIWHMTLDKNDKPLIITDGALNVMPNVKTKMHILRNVIDFSHRIGIARPKVAVLSATEEVLDSVQSSTDAKEITEIATKEKLNADVFGPLAFDNSISKKSAAIKGIKNIVAGQADVILVPSVETGNGLVKMMVYFMGACAAGVVIGGKVPVVITSRSDDAPARLASIAAAVVALD